MTVGFGLGMFAYNMICLVIGLTIIYFVIRNLYFTYSPITQDHVYIKLINVLLYWIRMNKKNYRVSRATLYNTIDLFRETVFK